MRLRDRCAALLKSWGCSGVIGVSWLSRAREPR